MAKGHKNDAIATTRIRSGNGKVKVYCAECNKPFEARRIDATFCSGSCRNAHSRRPERERETVASIDRMAFELATAMRNHNHSDKVFVAMTRLHTQIATLLYQFDLKPEAKK